MPTINFGNQPRTEFPLARTLNRTRNQFFGKMRLALGGGVLLASQSCCRFFDSREEICEGSSKSVGKAVNALERNIPRATFDVGNVSSVQTGPASQFLLRNT